MIASEQYGLVLVLIHVQIWLNLNLKLNFRTSSNSVHATITYLGHDWYPVSLENRSWEDEK
jgi:hypothetical protein